MRIIAQSERLEFALVAKLIISRRASWQAVNFKGCLNCIVCVEAF